MHSLNTNITVYNNKIIIILSRKRSVTTLFILLRENAQNNHFYLGKPTDPVVSSCFWLIFALKTCLFDSKEIKMIKKPSLKVKFNHFYHSRIRLFHSLRHFPYTEDQPDSRHGPLETYT